MEPKRLAVRFCQHGFHEAEVSVSIKQVRLNFTVLWVLAAAHRVGEQLAVAQLRAEHDAKNNRRLELAAASALSCPGLRVPADGPATQIGRGECTRGGNKYCQPTVS